MERNSAYSAFLVWLLIATLIESAPTFAGEAERVQGPGFSYVPPSGPGWHVASRSPTAVLYGKQPSGEMVGGRLTGHYTHSFLMAAIVDQPVSAGSSAAFVDAVRSAYSAQDPKSRIKTVRAFARHYGEPGVFCAEFEAVVNERDNPNYPGMLLLMEQHGIICLHRSLKFTVRLETSERRPAGEPSFLDQTSRHEADAFLRSLMIDAYREAPSSSGGAAPAGPAFADK
jgi:hypothetical protein